MRRGHRRARSLYDAKIPLKYGYETALFYLAFFLGMLFLNFTMDEFEPFSLALFAAALACGLPAPAQ